MLQSEQQATRPTDAGDEALAGWAATQRDGSEDGRGPGVHSVLEEVAALLRLDGPPDRFLAELLAAQCRLAGAHGSVLLQMGKENQVNLLASHPPLGPKDTGAKWIAQAAEDFRYVVGSKRTSIKQASEHPELADGPPQYIMVIPILNEETVRAAAAFVVRANSPENLTMCRKQLEITPFLLNSYETKLTLRQRHEVLNRICAALEVLSAFNKSKHLVNAAMALCNEMATRWHCNRVSLGFLSGRYVRVQAMSNTEKFSRHMKLVQDIEEAMEECLDQDVEVIHPAKSSATYVSRSAAQLAKDHGPAAVLGLPIRQDGDVYGVATLERSPERPFTFDEIEAARLTCDLCAPRLAELREHDRWFGARLAASVRKGFAVLLGPKNTWLKIWAVLVFVLIVFLSFAKGDYRVEAPFVFETTVHQVAVAPFDTFIKSVSVGPGDEVEADKTVLGELETSELRLKLAALKAEQLGYQKQMAAAMRDQKTGEAQMAQALNEKAAAEISLLELNLQQGTLVAPITGRIISEDLKRQIGAPVETGTVLFEIAPVDSLRAELYVPEDMIPDVKKGQEGVLASVGHPDQKMRFVVERINPVAEVVNQHNVFKVRVRLLEQRRWMRPGMEGIAKISVGQERYIWIGSRRLVNWLRMKLWF
jgi:multidrug resistance efflux pump/GAF domain-containing protein